MKIELLYFDDCPAYRTSRQLLSEVLAEEHLSAKIEMIEIKNDADARRWKFAGSPTIRLDGVDPFPQAGTNYGLACRVYVTPAGYRGWPTKAMLKSALHRALESQ
jgi:hypothetical protein